MLKNITKYALHRQQYSFTSFIPVSTFSNSERSCMNPTLNLQKIQFGRAASQSETDAISKLKNSQDVHPGRSFVYEAADLKNMDTFKSKLEEDTKVLISTLKSNQSDVMYQRSFLGRFEGILENSGPTFALPKDIYIGLKETQPGNQQRIVEIAQAINEKMLQPVGNSCLNESGGASIFDAGYSAEKNMVVLGIRFQA